MTLFLLVSVSSLFLLLSEARLNLFRRPEALSRRVFLACEIEHDAG